MLLTRLISSPQTPLLGQLLIDRGLINRDQLNDAMRQQSNQNRNDYKNLGQILIEKNIIADKQLQRCLRWQKVIAKTSILLTLTLAPFQFAQAQGQDNQHSWHASQLAQTGFEQHSQANATSSWDQDSEFSVSLSQVQQQLQQFRPKSSSDQARYNIDSEQVTLSEEGMHYQALLSTSSFGVDISYRF